MFAKLIFTKNLTKTLRYNEKKLEQGQASCILAENFAKDLEQLTRNDKLFHFRRLTTLNEKTVSNTIHISINFHPSEDFPDVQMIKLSQEYMQRIGFDEQPYLLYRHTDTGHPHLHLVTTNIRTDGSRIDLFCGESNDATDEMELKYALVKRQQKQLRLRAAYASKITYGQTSIKQAISEVLQFVVPTYKYTSLQELNAVLRLYNVRAEESRRNPRKKHRGLVYQTLNERGEGVGNFIRSSDFDSRPTLFNLEKQFALNVFERQKHDQHWQMRVTAAIDWTLHTQACDIPMLGQALAAKRITMVMAPDKRGNIQDIYYVDHETKAVYPGSTLGDHYTMSAIRERCSDGTAEQQQALKKSQELKEGQTHRYRLSL